ncbi:MAG: nucleotidyltransferase family protein [Thermoprotei archaeon]
MQALVLAGGRGLRLRPLTENVPKCLVEVRGKPILEHIFDWLSKNRIEEAVLAVGYKHEAVSEYLSKYEKEIPLKVSLSIEDKPLGTGGGMRQAAKNGLIKGDFVAVNGDVITDVNLIEMIDFFKAKKTEGIQSVIALKRERSPYGVALIDGDLVIHSFVEKPELEDVWINAGIYAMSYDVIDLLPVEGDLEKSLFPKLAWEHKIAGYKIEGYWRSVDSLKDIEEVNGEAKKNRDCEKFRALPSRYNYF